RWGGIVPARGPARRARAGARVSRGAVRAGGDRGVSRADHGGHGVGRRPGRRADRAGGGAREAGRAGVGPALRECAAGRPAVPGRGVRCRDRRDRVGGGGGRASGGARAGARHPAARLGGADPARVDGQRHARAAGSGGGASRAAAAGAGGMEADAARGRRRGPARGGLGGRGGAARWRAWPGRLPVAADPRRDAVARGPAVGVARCACGAGQGPSGACAADTGTRTRPLVDQGDAMAGAAGPEPVERALDAALALAVDLDGRLERLATREALERRLESGRGQLWVDIDSRSEAEWSLLSEVFRFHPLAIEDTRSPESRIKIEEYDGYLFVVARAVRFATWTPEPYDIASFNAYLFLGRNYLVTVHGEASRAVETVAARVETSPELMVRGVDHVAYMLLDTLVDFYFPLLDENDTFVDELEERIF